MQPRSDTRTRQRTITVTVRVPNGASGDLTTAATDRLARPDEVGSVTLEGLRDIEPGLSATVVTARVSVELLDGVDPAVLGGCEFVSVETHASGDESH